MAPTLEAKSEVLEYVSNFRLKVIEHFCHPGVILGPYIHGDMNLHVHGVRERGISVKQDVEGIAARSFDMIYVRCRRMPPNKIRSELVPGDR